MTHATRLRMLRWSIGLVLGTQAALLLLRPAGHGPPPAAVAALASLEVIAALLLLAPRTVLPGAVLLFAALVWAAALHLFLGEPPPAMYLVCAAGLWAVLPERKTKTGPLEEITAAKLAREVFVLLARDGR